MTLTHVGPATAKIIARQVSIELSLEPALGAAEILAICDPYRRDWIRGLLERDYTPRLAAKIIDRVDEHARETVQ